ncbi:MAG: DUF2568 domain-containing protein [Chloroflexi bacterium]|nr:MAG: DUF2568 domain-containing protein [Chloroflexota bacterium]
MVVLTSIASMLRVVLELALLAAISYFGFTFGGLVGWVLGLGLPAIVIAIWGAFVAPRAVRRLADPARLVLELVLFALGMGALAAVGQWPWGASHSSPHSSPIARCSRRTASRSGPSLAARCGALP